MRNDWEFNLAIKLFILMASITLLVVGQAFFIPFILAVFLSFLLFPISNKLEKIKVPKALAIIISILVALVFVAALIWFFVGQVTNFQDDLPLLKSKINEKGARIINWISGITHIEQDRIRSWMHTKIRESDDAGAQVVIGVFSFTGTFIAMLGLIPVYIFFLTYFKEKYKTFVKLISKDNHIKTIQIIEKISTVSKNYLKGVFIDVVILSVLSSVGYMLLGIKHAILFGVLAAMLNVIPYIGVLVGSLLPVIMAMITKDEIGYAIGAIGVAAVVQFLDNNIINPYIVGSSVSINPLTAIVVLIIGAMIWGIPGMVLSIPLAGVAKLICDNIETLKPYGFLIGEERTYGKKKFLSHK
jgi:predicted PurR-regulated permease PerM